MKLSSDQCYNVINTCFSNKFTSQDFQIMAHQNISFLPYTVCTRFTQYNYLSANCVFVENSSHINMSSNSFVQSSEQQINQEGNVLLVLLHVEHNPSNHFGTNLLKHRKTQLDPHSNDQAIPPWYIKGFADLHNTAWEQEGIDTQHYFKHNPSKKGYVQVVTRDNIFYTILVLNYIKIKPEFTNRFAHVTKLTTTNSQPDELYNGLINNYQHFISDRTLKTFHNPITQMIDIHCPKINKPTNDSDVPQYNNILMIYMRLIETFSFIHPHIRTIVVNQLMKYNSVVNTSQQVPENEETFLEDEISMSSE